MKILYLENSMKTLFFMLIMPVFSFGQILHSETFPFQNISSKAHSEKLYNLILNQGLFVDLELDSYMHDHRSMAILPVDFINSSQNKETSDDDMQKITLSISECIYNDFIDNLYHYSRQFLEIKNSIEVKDSNANSYVPQTQRDKYLENRKHQETPKKTISLQDPKETYKKLNALNISKLMHHSPEFLCEVLDVDVVLFISVHSDVFIPVRDCLSLKLLNTSGVFEFKFFSNLFGSAESGYIATQITSKLKLRNKKTQTFISLYDNSGKLIWLYGKHRQAIEVFNIALFNDKKGGLYSLSSTAQMLFPDFFEEFPYIYL